MRNLKRTLALVLAVFMMVGAFATVSAAPASNWTKPAVDYLDGIGVSKIGNDYDAKLSRNEFVLWIAKIESKQLSDTAWDETIASVNFSDVTDAHHKAAIAYSFKAGYIIGNGDGTFAPDKTVSLAEASAVIVRLMGYESKVTGLANEWDMNYMRAASTYCQAFDHEFYSHTDTFNPSYELTKGEAAYILATIMNGVNTIPSITQVTADGINLGEAFQNVVPSVKTNAYYVVSMPRISDGLAVKYAPYIEEDGQTRKEIERDTNALDTRLDAANQPRASVLLRSVADGTIVSVPAPEFMKAVRVSIGLGPTNDFMNEEPELNIFDTVQLGTMVECVIENGATNISKYEQLKNFKVSTNSLVVDTVLQMTSGDAKYLGYGVASVGSENWKPVLPKSYSEDKVVNWTNVFKDSTGKVTSAVLNFMGKTYVYTDSEDSSTINAYDPTWTRLSADEATKKIINAAQGEAYLVFNDTNGDGAYDTIIVKESYPFAYTNKPNVPSDTKDVLDFTTSIGTTGKAQPKGNAIGTVIWNQEASHAGGMSLNTDAFRLDPAATGKLQIVLCAANAHPASIVDPGNYSYGNHVLHFYTVVDLANFYTGIIEEVEAWDNNGNFSAKVKLTDGTYITVLIPVKSVPTATIPVTVGGATAEYTFDSSAWGTFMSDARKEALANGIAAPSNVPGYEDIYVTEDGDELMAEPVLPVRADFKSDEDFDKAMEKYNEDKAAYDAEQAKKKLLYNNFAAAWMAGKYVEFATNEDGVVICINGTEKAEGTTGFVTAVEKTDTGDNTYNITLGVEGSITNPYNREDWVTVYETAMTNNAFQWITWGGGNSRIKNGGHVHSPNKKYFVTTSGAYGIDANGDGNPDKSSEGYLIDANGDGLIKRANYKAKNHGVTGFKTFEVRASASGMFDWANYNVYNSLFNGNLIDPNHSDSGKVNPETDLVYVKMMKDAGSLNYVLYNSGRTVPAGGENRTGDKVKVKAADGTMVDWWFNGYIDETGGFWHQVNGENILSLEEVPSTRVIKTHANGTQYFEAKYNAKVGFEPYYMRKYDTSAKTYSYIPTFTSVKTMKDVVGTADAIIDTTKTLMIPVFQGATGEASVQVQVKTDAERAKYENSLDPKFYVDEAGYVFTIIGDKTIEYKKDAQNNVLYNKVKYDWAGATLDKADADVAFNTLDVDLYATAVITEKPKTAEGWFPGAYYLTIDGVTYNVTLNTNVALVTPSSDGFVIATKTLGDFLNEGATSFFAVDWSATVNSEYDKIIENIAILGTDKFVGDTPSTPSTDVNRVVYLDKDAEAIVKQNETGNEWMVISNKSAYVLPTGEDIGAIYRTYPTYAEAINASIAINLSIEGGKWYVVDENGKIVSDTNAYVTKGDLNKLQGTITDVKYDGTTIATMNGKKNVDITNMKTEYFYFDGSHNVLYKAGDSTNVQLIDQKAYKDLFKDLDDAVKDAQKAYDTANEKYKKGMLSDARMAYYADALATAKTALVEAKANSLDQYFNGQFWGIENSPVYRDFVVSQGSFQKPSTLTFDYIVIGDTLCVFSDSFVLG